MKHCGSNAGFFPRPAWTKQRCTMSELKRNAVLFGLLSALAAPSFGASWLVTNTNDTGPGSLRDALASANSTPGTNSVNFAIAGVAPFRVFVQSALPASSNSLVLDGTTQPGFAGQPVIVLDGSAAGAGVD